MKIFDRPKLITTKVKSLCSLEAVKKNEKEAWWRPYDCVEIFPMGYVPLFIVDDMDYASNLNDDILAIMPKSGSWVKSPLKGGYILVEVEKYEFAISKYGIHLVEWKPVNWDITIRK